MPSAARIAPVTAMASPRKGRLSRASRASTSAATPKTGGSASQNTASESTARIPSTSAVQPEAHPPDRAVVGVPCDQDDGEDRAQQHGEAGRAEYARDAGCDRGVE